MSDIASRRGFLGVLVGATASFLIARPSLAEAAEPRVLKFNHLHTGEKVAIEYWNNGAYEPQALGAINHLMRDFRTDDVHPIDPSLLDLLYELKGRTGTTRPFEIISAYRSPATNAILRSHRAHSGVASQSLHLKGQAIDIRLGDVPLTTLKRAALASGRGGVGYYPDSDFVHVDTGRIRTW